MTCESDVPIALGAGLDGGSAQQIETRRGILKGAEIWNLPLLQRLLKDARFAIHQTRVAREPIAAEHDVVLRPILRESGSFRSLSFLSKNAGHEGEKQRAHCNDTMNRPTLHSSLRKYIGLRPL
jgi:hypothetical protein